MPILDGTLLGEARVKKGWTQVELSEATKPRVDVSTISRIERGPIARVCRQQTHSPLVALRYRSSANTSSKHRCVLQRNEPPSAPRENNVPQRVFARSLRRYSSSAVVLACRSVVSSEEESGSRFKKVLEGAPHLMRAAQRLRRGRADDPFVAFCGWCRQDPRPRIRYDGNPIPGRVTRFALRKRPASSGTTSRLRVPSLAATLPCMKCRKAPPKKEPNGHESAQE